MTGHVLDLAEAHIRGHVNFSMAIDRPSWASTTAAGPPSRASCPNHSTERCWSTPWTASLRTLSARPCPFQCSAPRPSTAKHMPKRGPSVMPVNVWARGGDFTSPRRLAPAVSHVVSVAVLGKEAPRSPREHVSVARCSSPVHSDRMVFEGTPLHRALRTRGIGHPPRTPQ